MRRSEATNLHPGSIEHVALDARGGATIAAITPPEIRLRKSASLAALGSSRGGRTDEKKEETAWTREKNDARTARERERRSERTLDEKRGGMGSEGRNERDRKA